MYLQGRNAFLKTVNTQKMTQLAFDKAFTLRWHDQDGRLHVDRSNLTRVQVAPYRGSEIPGWETLKLDPEKVYYGYRPAEELGDEETIRSVQGIPIQLNHHLDYPDNPAKETRVGSTGDKADFDGTYLSNSLHIQDDDAIRRIKDGSMKQLSLAYHYEPDFNSSGEWKGQKFDFTMRHIRGQHLALVEEGRAGPTCVVEDHAFQKGEKSMNDDLNPKQPGKDGSPEVEKTEVKIADAMKMLADLLHGLHKQEPTGEIVDITTDEDKNAKIEEIAAAFAKLGASEEDVAKLKDSLADLAYQPDENQEKAEDEEIKDVDDLDEEDEDEQVEDIDDEAEDEGEEVGEFDQITQDALKACGYDTESPEFQKAFAEGVRYGERKEKEEPKKLDSEHESEGEKKALAAQDAAVKRFERKLDAIDECKGVLGNVRASAFDSADSVYMEALKQLDVSTRKITPSQAQAMYYGYIAGRRNAKKTVAQDAKPKESDSDLMRGIKVRL